MLSTVRQGSSGPEVCALQAQLNLAFLQKAPLVVDGIFGPLTGGRVRDFQKLFSLVADAVVGPITWKALGAVKAPGSPVSDGVVCDNGNPANQGKANFFAQGLRSIANSGNAFGFAGASSSSSLFGSGGGTGSSAAISIGGITMIPLIGSPHEAPARAVYVNSLHYDRIFFTAQRGAEGRAFTLAVPCPPFVVDSLPFGGFIQVLNLGPNPDPDTVIHELGHAWQSQHHSSATAYMANCLACQGAAAAANKLIGEQLDPSVKVHPRWPVNFPMSPYAYRPGSAFGTYGGEQIAEQIENNEAPIRSHVTAQAAGTKDNDNVKSLELTNIRMEDRRSPGLKM